MCVLHEDVERETDSYSPGCLCAKCLPLAVWLLLVLQRNSAGEERGRVCVWRGIKFMCGGWIGRGNVECDMN